MMTHPMLISAILLLMSVACTPKVEDQPSPSATQSEAFTVIINGNIVGHLKATTAGNDISIDYDYKNNGRGPGFTETITLDSEGLPLRWDINGKTTFGNNVEEHFSLLEQSATWTDATGTGSATVDQPTLYINQFGSPYAAGIFARALLRNTNQSLPALPAGQLNLIALDTIEVTSASATLGLQTYALSGADLNPDYLILDRDHRLFAVMTPQFITLRSGFEGEEKRLRELAERYSTQRYESIQAQVAHRYEGAVRIRNVRVFDPQLLRLTTPVSVLVRGEHIVSIDAPDLRPVTAETEIDGAGGTLVAGLYDMHGHMDDNDALLNIAAGVTSVRDMGNNNEVLDGLMQKIESGVLAGPRITRLGFIEGKSPFSSNNGILVESEQEALAAVNTYSKKGFTGIKLYNSMNGDWAPAIVQEAHRLNMTVAGHVPAFSNANAMLNAGFDEMTHINQIMLGWVLNEGEDTRSLLRLTALTRLPSLDLDSAPVKKTLDLMTKNGIGIDPTLAIHEYLLLSRNGETRAGTVDYIDHMPPGVQRGAKVALANIANADEDTAYRGAYEKIIATLKMMKARGLLIIPGTDLGGAFNLHRELELYQQLGFSPAELLKLDTYDMAHYLGHQKRGAIAPGMLADFFLVPGDPTTDLKAIKTISMVSRGGVFYFPSEIYPMFGIKPFIAVPTVHVSSQHTGNDPQKTTH